MNNLIIRKVVRGVKYAPLGIILGASLLNVTVLQRQFLMLLLLVWAGVFFLFRMVYGQ